jgi:Family of unknown function (DUF5677)
MSDKENLVLSFGYPEEGEKFQRRHPLWAERFVNLTGAIEMAFTRVQMMSEPADKFVYFYGRMCAEDFMEILLVCGHGYGVAGMKLLRSMFEHVVTLRYLHEHPDEVEAFMNYNHVQRYKLMKPILETFGKDVLPPETVADVERKYAEVKEDFMITDCDKCGTKRLNHTWNKMDFVSMAKKTGAIGTLIVSGYFLPLRHAHSTFGGLSERLETVDDRIGFQPESQPDLADQALNVAHNCILNVLEVQNERFKIDGLQEQLQTCFRDYLEVWVPDSKLLNDKDKPA